MIDYRNLIKSFYWHCIKRLIREVLSMGRKGKVVESSFAFFSYGKNVFFV